MMGLYYNTNIVLCTLPIYIIKKTHEFSGNPSFERYRVIAACHSGIMMIIIICFLYDDTLNIIEIQKINK